MRKPKGVFWLWLSAVAVSLASLLLPNDGSTTVSGFISYVSQLLLFILSVYLVGREPVRKNKFIFLNFAVFFGTSLLFHLYHFVGTFILPGSPYARFFFTEYVSLGGYFLLLALAVVYLAIDTLFRDHRVVTKYLLSFALAGGFFWYYYQDYVRDPFHLYRTETALTWGELSESYARLQKTGDGSEPTPVELIRDTELHYWREGARVGMMYEEEKARTVTSLYPYLSGDNYKILFFAPLYENVVYMNILCVGFILLFFGYQYRRDPPQGAYIDKIMFLLALFCAMEILHAWSFIKSVEWRTFHEYVSIGQYVSSAILALVCWFFALRLRFVTSVKGEYYEQEIQARPAGITRWRDWLDDFVLAHFFNRKEIVGRMFAKSAPPD
ncbi:MAG: hypothetical protein WB626_06580 [Bacteroidota bacterium]